MLYQKLPQPPMYKRPIVRFVALLTKLCRATHLGWVCSAGDWLWTKVRLSMGESKEGMEWRARRSRGGRG